MIENEKRSFASPYIFETKSGPKNVCIMITKILVGILSKNHNFDIMYD